MHVNILSGLPSSAHRMCIWHACSRHLLSLHGDQAECNLLKADVAEGMTRGSSTTCMSMQEQGSANTADQAAAMLCACMVQLITECAPVALISARFMSHEQASCVAFVMEHVQDHYCIGND